MFSYLSPEQRVPKGHPLRVIRALTDDALRSLSRPLAALYSTTGRPSIPPEQLLRALLLQVLYTVRSERLLIGEALHYNLLFRWFVGLNMDDPVWHPTTFSKNRDRLLAGEIAARFFDAVRAQARAAGLLSDEHFTVDGTQLEAWASLRNATADALELKNLVYGAESGRFWEEHPEHFKPEERVDRVLLDNLTESHRLLRDADLPADAAQALLVQAMFIAYLEDREIIGAEYFRDATNARAGNFETLLKSGDVELLESLFGTLREDFNGDLFVAPCSFEANDRGPRLHVSHLAILDRFRSGREEMHGLGGQYRLWPYDFKYIPQEASCDRPRHPQPATRNPSRRWRGRTPSMVMRDT